jgi:hypothetical protein
MQQQQMPVINGRCSGGEHHAKRHLPGSEYQDLEGTDDCGNTSTCSATISVQDITAPSITCPANTTIACRQHGLGQCNGQMHVDARLSM